MPLLIDETLDEARVEGEAGAGAQNGAHETEPAPLPFASAFTVVPPAPMSAAHDRSALLRLYGDVRVAVASQLGLCSEQIKGVDAALLELQDVEGERGQTVLRLLAARRGLAAAYQQFGTIMYELAPQA